MHNILQIVNRSNQRGGRMLSVIDLLEAGTLSREQVCWLLARIREGKSWLVGAVPGGAGKTTVMSALLAMLPADEEIRLTITGTDWEYAKPGNCVVAYEISPGAYDAYVWGSEVAKLCELGAAGCRIVANLHADTLEQACDQVVNQCGASMAGFASFDMFLPITLSGKAFSRVRRIQSIHCFNDGEWRELQRADMRLQDTEGMYAAFLDDCLGAGLRTCAEVRAAWLRWLKE